MITPNETPITQEWGEPSWTRWLAEVGDCIKGVWGNEKISVEVSGIDAIPDCYIACIGQAMVVSMRWANGMTSSNGKIKIPIRNLSGAEKYYQFEPSITRAIIVVSDHSSAGTDVRVNGDTLFMTDVSTPNEIYLSGTLIIKPLRSDPQS